MYKFEPAGDTNLHAWVSGQVSSLAQRLWDYRCFMKRLFILFVCACPSVCARQSSSVYAHARTRHIFFYSLVSRACQGFSHPTHALSPLYCHCLSLE